MNRTKVKSSNISSVGYESDSSTLEIEFNSGTIYQYYSVSERIFKGLINAGSVGSYFDTNVKDAGYRYKKVN